MVPQASRHRRCRRLQHGCDGRVPSSANPTRTNPASTWLTCRPVATAVASISGTWPSERSSRPSTWARAASSRSCVGCTTPTPKRASAAQRALRDTTIRMHGRDGRLRARARRHPRRHPHTPLRAQPVALRPSGRALRALARSARREDPALGVRRRAPGPSAGSTIVPPLTIRSIESRNSSMSRTRLLSR
jgi:hypothetical protein